MRDFEKQLYDYRLITAEIIYRMPDHQIFLQSFIWQDYDIAPKFPVLTKFLKFWERELEGPIHSVRLDKVELITTGKGNFVSGEFYA